MRGRRFRENTVSFSMSFPKIILGVGMMESILVSAVARRKRGGAA